MDATLNLIKTKADPLEALTEECVCNEGSATGQKTNMGFETVDPGHTHYFYPAG